MTFLWLIPAAMWLFYVRWVWVDDGPAEAVFAGVIVGVFAAACAAAMFFVAG